MFGWFSRLEGFRMSRFFGFLVAVLMSTGMANAALLATWNFQTNSNGVVSGGPSVGTATAFVNYGTVVSGFGINGSRVSTSWTSAGINTASNNVSMGNGFSFTNTDSSTKLINSISFSNFVNAAPVTGNMPVSNTVSVQVYTSVNGGSYQFETSVSASTSSVLSTASVSRTLNTGDKLDVRFVYTGRVIYLDQFFVASFGPTTAVLDNIQIFGDVTGAVPEPASMACFAGLFAVGALRRLRKRS